MDIIRMRKLRFWYCYGMQVALVFAAALTRAFYDTLLRFAPGLPSQTTMEIAVAITFLIALMGTWINLSAAHLHPQECGVGQVVGVAAGVITVGSIFMVGIFTYLGLYITVSLISSVTGFILSGFVIFWDDTETRRIEIEAHAAGTRRLNGGTEPI